MRQILFVAQGILREYEPMTQNQKRFGILLTLLFAFSATFAQPSVDAGKTVFRNYCATCHAKDMKTDLTGPALGGTEERWADYPREDLYEWIRNSQKLIAAGHPRATELWDDWKPTVMTAWPNLTDEDIESVLLYINDVYTAVPTAADAGTGAGVASDTGAHYNWLYYVLFGLLVVLTIILARIITSLDTIIRVREGLDVDRTPLLKKVFSKRVVSFMIFLLVLVGGYTTVSNAISLGRQQGYAPDQPINFSHTTHAGLHQIDCQYCHDGARRSKHAVIPAANTCMNCHSAIKNGSQWGTAELTKIYASVGYDPTSSQYIENYQDLAEDEIAEIYKKWISDTYIADNGLNVMDEKGQRLVEEQWQGIKASLTNAQKEEIPGPIEWIRIHNLPDHVYFNHKQHVAVGQIECQTCHGTVEEMDVVQQYSPLSMGWCINCHRQTEVQFEGNEYYTSYERYHEQLANGAKEKITVEDIGGLECQKCHY